MGAYGWNATIGFIGPPRTNETVLHEAIGLAPPGVSWCWSVMGLPEFGQYEFDQALGLAEVCARELASREVSVIVMTGIPLMTSKGAPYHEQLERRIAAATGNRIPVTSDLACVIGSLRALGLDRIAVASIYQRYIQDNMIRYLEHYGIRIVADEALDYALADCLTRPTMTTAYDSAKRVLARARGAAGLFIACPQWPVIGQIERLEREHGLPVLTHLSAILWGSLSQIGLRLPVTDRGKLLAQWPQWPSAGARAA
jgi:maleate cis-trans isomerase